MRACDVAGDGEAEAAAALILIAGIVEPQERLEYFLPHVLRNAGAIVIYGNREPAMVAMARNRNRLRIARRVGHEIAEAALERGLLHRHHRQSLERHRRGVAVALSIATQFLQGRGNVGGLRPLVAVAACKGEIGFQHP